MPHLNAQLSINQLELPVFLGWPENERKRIQTITLDMLIQFANPPLACETDELNDTFCYAKLISAIKKHIEDRHFYLVEHLSADLYEFIQTQLPADTKLSLTLSKFPAIKGLTGGISFRHGNTELTSES